MRAGEIGIEGDVRENPTPSPPALGRMMRFGKGQRHLSVGEVFSGSVSLHPPPLSSWSVIPCHSHLPGLMTRGPGEPRGAASLLGCGSFDPAV